jgi:hypothetical protein
METAVREVREETGVWAGIGILNPAPKFKNIPGPEGRIAMEHDTRRGLLAAENLIADLHRMETVHHQRNVREKELSPTISPARLDPTALTELRTSGRCIVQIPEAFVDMHYPGYYFCRTKALGISVPCLTGPHRTIGLKVTQTSNRIRINTDRKAGAVNDLDAYTEDPAGDARFRYNVGAIQSISTSHGEDDTGLFSLQYEDERYLPFEGGGFIGTYVLELPPIIRNIDSANIPDVFFNFRITACDGGGGFHDLAANTIRERLNALVLKTGRTGLFHAIDLRRDKPDLWNSLVITGSASLQITEDDLPYFAMRHGATILNTSRILARVHGEPVTHTITVATNPVILNAPPQPNLHGLLSSSLNGLAMATPFVISAPLAPKLRDIIIII